MRPVTDLQRRVAPFEVVTDMAPAGDQPAAIAAYRNVLGVDDTDLSALDALERLYAGGAGGEVNGRELVQTLERKIELTTDVTARQELRHAAAQVYQIQLDGQTRVDSLQSGQAQIAEGAPALSFKTLTASGQYNKLIAPISGAGEYAVINNSKWPTNDVNVRRAIMYAINRAGMVKSVFDGYAQLTRAGVPNGSPFYHANVPEIGYSPAKAKQILTADGWKVGKGGVRYKNGKPLALTILSNSNAPWPRAFPSTNCLPKTSTRPSTSV